LLITDYWSGLNGFRRIDPFNQFLQYREKLARMEKQIKRISTPYDDLTYKIIGCAMAVHRNLSPGYRENTCQRDLEVYFTESGVVFEAQKLYEVYDSLEGNTLIGYYIPDFVVAGTVIVEIKALRGIDNSHLAQVIGYLAVTGCPIALLINFGERSLKYKRILPPKHITEHQVNHQRLYVPEWLKPDHEP
jgi:GxxExxY protein